MTTKVNPVDKRIASNHLNGKAIKDVEDCSGNDPSIKLTFVNKLYRPRKKPDNTNDADLLKSAEGVAVIIRSY